MVSKYRPAYHFTIFTAVLSGKCNLCRILGWLVVAKHIMFTNCNQILSRKPFSIPQHRNHFNHLNFPNKLIGFALSLRDTSGQTVIFITVRRRRWQLVHLCAVHTTHNSSHLADCVSSPGRLPSDHVREYVQALSNNLFICVTMKIKVGGLIWKLNI